MQRASIGALCTCLALGLATLVGVGCAEGTDPDAVGESELLNLPFEAGDEKGLVLPPSAPPANDASADATTDAATKADGGTEAGTDAGPPTNTCPTTNTCAAATNLGQVNGDSGQDVQTAQGTGSQWFTVRVNEDDHDIFGVAQEIRVELQSPVGTNFDLYVYRAAGSSGQECSAVTASSVSTGGFDTVSNSWGESSLSNGNDDSRTVTIEVRHVSGTCTTTAPWTLTVRGDVL